MLKRSLLFVFVTGEEKGLLGARYFTTHPTVKPGSMIANINIDMFLPIVPLKVLTVYGLAESDMGDMAREVAQSLGVQVQADPEPQRNAFIHSDQYDFIRTACRRWRWVWDLRKERRNRKSSRTGGCNAIMRPRSGPAGGFSSSGQI